MELEIKAISIIRCNFVDFIFGLSIIVLSKVQTLLVKKRTLSTFRSILTINCKNHEILINFVHIMLEYKNVSIAYDTPIIENFSLHLKKGEKLAIAGASGIGKSTLLHSVLGFVEIQKGEIMINNICLSPTTIRQIRKTTGWLPQELSLRFEFVSDLFFFPFTFSQNKKTIPSDEEIAELLDLLKLNSSILLKKTDEISGGQKQRVAIASQLLLKKPLLLMDEPTSALDNESQSAVLNALDKYSNLSLISATHNMNWLNRMDRVINLPKKNK